MFPLQRLWKDWKWDPWDIQFLPEGLVLVFLSLSRNSEHEHRPRCNLWLLSLIDLIFILPIFLPYPCLRSFRVYPLIFSLMCIEINLTKSVFNFNPSGKIAPWIGKTLIYVGGFLKILREEVMSSPSVSVKLTVIILDGFDFPCQGSSR